jgi:membrane protein
MGGLIRFIARIFTVNILVHRLRNDEGDRPRSDRGTHSTPRDRVPGRGPAGGQEDTGLRPPTGHGTSPDSPLQLEKDDWKATAKRTLKEIKDDRVPLIAAGMAFYFFLAIFPALIAFIGIMGLVNVDVSGVIEAIQRNMPGGSGAILVEAVQAAENPSEKASLFAAIFGIGTALWSASSGMVALQQGLDVAYDIPEDRKFVGKRAIALLLIVLTGLFGGVPSPFFTFGDGLVLSIIGWVLTLVAVMILFALFYFIGPNRKERNWRWVSTGGIVGAVLWIVASVGFGYYAGNFGSYSKTYGPLAGVIILIFWLYLSSFSVLVGGELNAEFERQGNRVARRRSEGSAVR